MEIGEGITIGNITYSDDLATVLSADKDITSFELIRGVRVIGTNAFAGCRNLRVVRIPETVIRIEDYAFRDCTYIRDLYLPFYIEYISPLAFTNSHPDKEHPYQLRIPNVHIPKDAFRKYAYLLPQYIDWMDCEEYDIPLYELEEDDEFDYLQGLPIFIDEHEALRMAVVDGLDKELVLPEDLERDVVVNSSVEKDIVKEMWSCALKDCGFLLERELVDSKDYPVIDNIDKSFGLILASMVKNTYSFGWACNGPMSMIENALSEALQWGAILPIIWETPDDNELYGDGLYFYCHSTYGDLVGYFQENVLKEACEMERWNEQVRLNYHGILESYVKQYTRRGYAITIPLFQKLFHDCMRMMFQIGFSYGLKYRRIHGQ